MAKTQDYTLTDEAATARLAAEIGKVARAGDTLLLSGQIGAGKSAFARALIRSLTHPNLDVPSPTFTLVQTYDAPAFEVWHCDLYRLTDPQEVLELGLDDAFRDGLCLIEWPDRLGDLTPPNALHLNFVAGDASHHVTLDMPGDWPERLDGLHV